MFNNFQMINDKGMLVAEYIPLDSVIVTFFADIDEDELLRFKDYVENDLGFYVGDIVKTDIFEKLC